MVASGSLPQPVKLYFCVVRGPMGPSCSLFSMSIGFKPLGIGSCIRTAFPLHYRTTTSLHMRVHKYSLQAKEAKR